MRARRRIVLVFGATRFVVVRPLAGCSRGAHAWRQPPCGSMMSQKKADMWENGPSLQFSQREFFISVGLSR